MGQVHRTDADGLRQIQTQKEEEMKAFINLKNVETVRLYQKGFTDYLTISYEDRHERTWSVDHYEESYTQRERCKQLEACYQQITLALKKGESFIEIRVDDN
jgi:hypothetical protein